MSTTPTLDETISPAGADEAASQEIMDQEGHPSPTLETQLGLQNLGIGDRDKHAKEIDLCSTLLDQVRGVLGLDTDRVTRSKSKVPPTQKDLDDALLCSSITGFRHAEAVGKVALQNLDLLKKDKIEPNTESIKTLQERVDSLEQQLKNLEPRVVATEKRGCI